MNKVKAYRNFSNQSFWLVVILIGYLILLSVSIGQHELWGDEVHSWNIAKASFTLPDLLINIRYEGHPPMWYLILFIISKLTHNPLYMQCVHVLICGVVAFLLLFYSKFSTLHKILILAGYYFSFEYAAISRNYSFGILIAFIICIIIQKDFKNKNVLYYILLLMLSNTHLLAFILALSLHVYFLLLQKKEKIGVHTLLGLFIILPAVYFIIPPANNNITPVLLQHMFSKEQLFTVMQAPTKSFLPIPAWWLPNFWNTHFLVEAGNTIKLLNYSVPLVSFTVLASIINTLRVDKKVLCFFLLNISITLCVGFIFPLSSARYVGYLFISFIAALWLIKAKDIRTTKKQDIIITILLSAQLIGTGIALKNDWTRPFSQINKIKIIANTIPMGEKITTDFWCLNYLAAVLDKPFYCVGFETEKSFLVWDNYSTAINKNPHLYVNGIKKYLQKNHINSCYLISNTSLETIIEKDSTIKTEFTIETLAHETNAIEKYSNIYLFKFTFVLNNNEIH